MKLIISLLLLFGIAGMAATVIMFGAFVSGNGSLQDILTIPVVGLNSALYLVGARVLGQRRQAKQAAQRAMQQSLAA